jgi:hypothetical protein
VLIHQTEQVELAIVTHGGGGGGGGSSG